MRLYFIFLCSMICHLATAETATNDNSEIAFFWKKEKTPPEENYSYGESEPSCDCEECYCSDYCKEYIQHCGFDDCATFSAWGEWIYMRPLNTNLEYARVIDTILQEASPNFVNAKEQCIKTKFSSGYQIFASYIAPRCDCCYTWDLRASYMAINNSKSTSTRAKDSLFIIPVGTFIPGNNLRRVLFASAKVKYKYQAVDAEFGWRMQCECPFSLRAFAGIRWANLKEKYSAFYTDPADITNSNLVFETSYKRAAKFDGVGPRIGFNANWIVGSGFGLFGDFGAQLLIAKKRGDLTQLSLDPLADQDLPLNLTWTEKFCKKTAIIPNFDIKLGATLKYTCFNCVALSMQGGYRALYFINALENVQITGNNTDADIGVERLRQSTTLATDEDFGLIGWFVNAGIEF